MEVDTGSDLSIMSYADFNKNFKNKMLEKINVILKTYTGERVEVVGMARVKVEYLKNIYVMNLYIVKNGSNPLFGREWLKSISINKKNSVSNVVTDSKTLPTVVHKKIKLLREEFSSVFED